MGRFSQRSGIIEVEAWMTSLLDVKVHTFAL